MSISIRESESIDEHLQSWKIAMQNMPWFREHRLFDYDPDEIIEDIKQAYHDPNNLFLVAHQTKTREDVGVLGITVKNNVAMLGRWEPAVVLGHGFGRVGKALLDEAISQLRERHVSKIRCILKFPYGRPQRAMEHTKLYRKCGFTLERPCGVLLLADLSKALTRTSTVAGLRVVEGSRLPLADFADFTERAYTSTPEDRLVHQEDLSISDRASVLKSLEAIKTGRLGSSLSECWRVAKVSNIPAGFIIGVIQKDSKYRPARGIIAQLGVFPEFRRRGIGMVLIDELFRVFKEHGCAYSFVGTPKANDPALKLYCKMDHSPIFEQIDFHRTL